MMRSGLIEEFDGFIDEHTAMLDRLAQLDGGRRHVDLSVAEARNAASVLEPHLRPEARLLEVGAGLGILSSFLASRSYQVTALEPGGTGFESRSAIDLDMPAWSAVARSSLRAEDVTVDAIGTFDVIFSMNVLEHVDDPGQAIASLTTVLEPDGVMVHSCPNYLVPYEPHFGIPLLPLAPGATARVLPGRISGSTLWQSLNFVTSKQILAIAEQTGLDVTFSEGQIGKAFARFGSDPEFGSRHRVLTGLSNALAAIGVLGPALGLVDRIPARYLTPMTFLLRPSPGAGSAGAVD